MFKLTLFQWLNNLMSHKFTNFAYMAKKKSGDTSTHKKAPPKMEELMKKLEKENPDLEVDSEEFDVILKKLLNTPPKKKAKKQEHSKGE